MEPRGGGPGHGQGLQDRADEGGVRVQVRHQGHDRGAHRGRPRWEEEFGKFRRWRGRGCPCRPRHGEAQGVVRAEGVNYQAPEMAGVYSRAGSLRAYMHMDLLINNHLSSTVHTVPHLHSLWELTIVFHFVKHLNTR